MLFPVPIVERKYSVLYLFWGFSVAPSNRKPSRCQTQKNVWWDIAIPFLRSYDLLAFRLIKTYFKFSLTILGSIPEYEMKTPSRRAQLLPWSWFVSLQNLESLTKPGCFGFIGYSLLPCRITTKVILEKGVDHYWRLLYPALTPARLIWGFFYVYLLTLSATVERVQRLTSSSFTLAFKRKGKAFIIYRVPKHYIFSWNPLRDISEFHPIWRKSLNEKQQQWDILTETAAMPAPPLPPTLPQL